MAKLAKGKSMLEATHLAVQEANQIIRDAKTIIAGDPYLDRVKEFVPAGENPVYPDILDSVRNVVQALERAESRFEALEEATEAMSKETATIRELWSCLLKTRLKQQGTTSSRCSDAADVATSWFGSTGLGNHLLVMTDSTKSTCRAPSWWTLWRSDDSHCAIVPASRCVRSLTSDFVIPRVGVDLPVGIDPFLLFKSREPGHQQLHQQLLSAFNRGIQAIRHGDSTQARMLFDYPEVSEIGLGYTQSGKRGSGVGTHLSGLIIDTLAQSPVLQERGVKHVEEMQLLSAGIGPDRVSDITATFLRAI